MTPPAARHRDVVATAISTWLGQWTVERDADGGVVATVAVVDGTPSGRVVEAWFVADALCFAEDCEGLPIPVLRAMLAAHDRNGTGAGSEAECDSQ